MTGYYDIVLGLIPISLAGLTALLTLAGMSLTVSLPLASVVTIGLMGHAMFVNAPVAPTTEHSPAQRAGDGVRQQTGDSSAATGVTAD